MILYYYQFLLPLCVNVLQYVNELCCFVCSLLWFLANVRYGSSAIRLSDVCLSVACNVRSFQVIEIFRNVSTPCGTLAIRDLCIKILRRSSQGNPSVGGIKHKRGSPI